MSQKITGKNLQYETHLPPFLARLRGQYAADSQSPDPILAARRRPARPRSASEEAEDAPVVVDDEGNVVQDVEVGLDGSVREKEPRAEGKEGDDDEERRKGTEGGAPHEATEQVAAIGASRKRKAGRVVGGDADEEEEEEITKRTKKGGSKSGDSAGPREDASHKAHVKGKKKAKKIKLSFGDDDGD